MCDFTKNESVPNWRLMTPEEFESHRYPIEGFPEPDENPVKLPQQYGGTLEMNMEENNNARNHGDNMMEFDIRTSTEEAIKILKSKQQPVEVPEEPQPPVTLQQPPSYGLMSDFNFTPEPVAAKKEARDWNLEQGPTSEETSSLI